MTMLDDIPRIIHAARNGEPLTKLEILALAETLASSEKRVQALERALDIAQLIIGVRSPVTTKTQPLVRAA